ncbi:hypothetical protein VTN77DRAFT_3369 [Rasamsonia byssochlamydoides]|uniref:uncharacterized protein n=1 Tax=Rasamsonia byssochlamydoides TaxID=89139 RepID=UPI0037431399
MQNPLCRLPRTCPLSPGRPTRSLDILPPSNSRYDFVFYERTYIPSTTLPSRLVSSRPKSNRNRNRNQRQASMGNKNSMMGTLLLKEAKSNDVPGKGTGIHISQPHCRYAIHPSSLQQFSMNRTDRFDSIAVNRYGWDLFELLYTIYDMRQSSLFKRQRLVIITDWRN